MNKNQKTVVIVAFVLLVLVAILYLFNEHKLPFQKKPTAVTEVGKVVAPAIQVPVVASAPTVAPAAECAKCCCCCPCSERKAPAVKPPQKKKVAHKKVVKAVPLPAPKEEKLAPVTKDTACPDGWSIIANAWSLGTLPGDIRKKAEGLIAVAGSRSSYRGDDVSRTIGGQLRNEVKTRTPINAEIQVFYRDPKTLAVVKNLGTLYIVAGTGSFRFPDDPRHWIVETVWPENFISPTVSGGKHRLWVFPDEWGKYCTPNEHGIIP